MDTYGQSPSRYTADAIQQMNALGAVRMEAHYSGGNDEGGITDIRLFDKAGEPLEAPDYFLERAPKLGDHEWQIHDGKVQEEHPLWQAANEIMSTKYGTWCGEFHAYGTLFIDVATRKAWTEGEYEVMTSYGDSEGIEVSF